MSFVKMKVKPEVYIRRLVDLGESFTITLTGSTVKVQVDGEKGFKMHSPTDIPIKELYFVKMVKQFARTQVECGFLQKVDVSPTNITYFKNSKKARTGFYNNVVELDVNSAYWNIALEKGYIDKSLYDKGLQMSKITRLVSLGSLATTKQYIHYDAELNKFEDMGKDYDEVLRSFFFDVSKTLDDMMLECFEMIGYDNVFFYWVDAFFIKKEYQKQVHEFFENRGLKLKTKLIKSMYINNEEDKKSAIVYEDIDFTKTENRLKYLSDSKEFCNLPVKDFTFKSGNTLLLKAELQQYIDDDRHK